MQKKARISCANTFKSRGKRVPSERKPRDHNSVGTDGLNDIDYAPVAIKGRG